MKKRKVVAVAMAVSMMLGQTVYAQEYTVPIQSAEAAAVETSSEYGNLQESEADIQETETEVQEGKTDIQETETDALESEGDIQESEDETEIQSTDESYSEDDEYDDSDEEETDEDETDESDGGIYDRPDQCGENTFWTLDEDGTLTISGEGAVYDYRTSRDTPWSEKTVKKLVVEEGITEIGSRTFSDNDKLQEVQLPSTLKEIPYGCFAYCTSLKEVTISDGTEKIDSHAFSTCAHLKKVVIPASVTDIDSDAFDDWFLYFYIIGTKGSAAEAYALEKGITFVDADNPVISMDLCDFFMDGPYFAYDGTPKTPKPIVIDGNKQLKEGEDYTLSYQNNQEVGTASVTITGTGKPYSGEQTIEFQVVKVSNELHVGDNYVAIDTQDEDSMKCTFVPEQEGFYRFKAEGGEHFSSLPIFGSNIRNLTMNGKFDSEIGYDEDDVQMITPTSRLFPGRTYELDASLENDDTAKSLVMKVTVEELDTKGEVNGVSWDYSQDGVLTVDGENLTYAVVYKSGYPWVCVKNEARKIVFGSHVKEIPENLFEGYKHVRSVELPDGLTRIGAAAFRGCNLKSIVIPDSVNSIGEYALGYDQDNQLIPYFKIIGAKETAAETYASDNQIQFVDSKDPAVDAGLKYTAAVKKYISDIFKRFVIWRPYK